MKRQKTLWTVAAVLALLGTALTGVAGMRFSAALFWAAALAVILIAVLDRLAREKPWAKTALRALLILLGAGLALFLAMEAMVLREARTDAEGKDVAAVIILGAGVDGMSPSLSLRTRLDAALEYIADKPDVPVVVSGGQGRGELITEAECMARYLRAHGVDESRILREDRAANTHENFGFSFALLRQNGVEPERGVAFVTSAYHIARGKRLAGDVPAYGVASHLPRSAYYDALEVNYHVREAFALAKTLFFGA